MEANMVWIKNILCPVDFSPPSLSAANYAIALASNYEAKLHFLHVVSPTLYSADQYAFNVGEIVATLEKEAARQMKKLARKAAAAGVTFKQEVRTGDVEYEIRKMMKSAKADFLVMGTHGHRGLEKWFLGSVTERMLRRSVIPLLTIRGTARIQSPPALKRILVTTDFSEGTNRALDYAFSIAQECQAKITLMHVIDERAPDTLEAGELSLAASARQQLEKLIPEEALDWCDSAVRVEFGNPYQVISNTLASDNIDLLVMNIHGKGMLDRALLGSTAERLVRAARCPIMLVPPAKVARRRAA
jgi:nucleotide-binding universal stress UspA family protein